MAGELPLLEAEPPHLEHALAFRNLHPELQIVAVRLCRRLESSNRQTLTPIGRAVKSHNAIIPDRIDATLDESGMSNRKRSVLSTWRPQPDVHPTGRSV